MTQSCKQFMRIELEGPAKNKLARLSEYRGLPIPDYPAESCKRGEQGVVVVDIEVLPDGKPGQIKLITDSGFPRLNEAVISAIREATFSPATQDGEPVVGHLQIPFRFVL